MMIYKIFRPTEWAQLQSDGKTKGAPIDLTDGYIHFSTAQQVRETASRYFAGIDGLILLAVPGDALGDDLKWEPARKGALFPHLFRDLLLSDVAWSIELELVEGTHILPDLT